MSTNDGPDRQRRLMRRLRAEVRRGDKLIMNGYRVLGEAKWVAEHLGEAADPFLKKLDRILVKIGRLTFSATAAVREFEEEAFPGGQDSPTATKLLLEGGSVAEPDALALSMLLDLVEIGDPEAPESENKAARNALVWLLREQETALDQIRKLAKIAAAPNSEDIKLAGKAVD